MNKSKLYYEITNLSRAGKYAEAECLLKTSDISDSEKNECVGNIHFYKREMQKAIYIFEHVLESDEQYDCARYHYLIGVQQEMAGNLEDAFKRYQAAIEIEPSFVDSYVELGGLLYKVEDYKGAHQCFSDALLLDESDIGVFHNNCMALAKLADVEPNEYAEKYRVAQEIYEIKKPVLGLPKERHSW